MDLTCLSTSRLLIACLTLASKVLLASDSCSNMLNGIILVSFFCDLCSPFYNFENHFYLCLRIFLYPFMGSLGDIG